MVLYRIKLYAAEKKDIGRIIIRRRFNNWARFKISIISPNRLIEKGPPKFATTNKNHIFDKKEDTLKPPPLKKYLRE